MDKLFQMVCSSQCYSKSCSISLFNIFRSPTYGGFPPLYSPLHSFPSSTCLPSNPALKYLSSLAAFLIFCGGQWLKTLFRGLLHINAARKAAVMHLMRWQQLFPKIFLRSYPFLTHLKSIFVAEISWKITKIKVKLT